MFNLNKKMIDKLETLGNESIADSATTIALVLGGLGAGLFDCWHFSLAMGERAPTTRSCIQGICWVLLHAHATQASTQPTNQSH